MGAVLSNSYSRSMAYAIKTFNKAEKNYFTIENELLAIVWLQNILDKNLEYCLTTDL